MTRPSPPPGSPGRTAPPRPATAAVRLLALAALSLAVAAPLDAQADSLRVAGDVSLHYELSGAGPPLVLIHGWTHDARVWELQTPELTREFTLLRYDRRGWGRSGGSPDVSMDPGDLDSLMAAVGLDDAHVVGHSQGASVALRFALAHPSRVRSVTLYGAPPPAEFGVPPVGEDTFPDMAAIVRDHGLDSLGAVLFSHPLGRGFERGGRGLELARELWAANARRAFEDPQPPSGATPRALDGPGLGRDRPRPGPDRRTGDAPRPAGCRRAGLRPSERLPHRGARRRPRGPPPGAGTVDGRGRPVRAGRRGEALV